MGMYTCWCSTRSPAFASDVTVAYTSVKCFFFWQRHFRNIVPHIMFLHMYDFLVVYSRELVCFWQEHKWHHRSNLQSRQKLVFDNTVYLGIRCKEYTNFFFYDRLWCKFLSKTQFRQQKWKNVSLWRFNIIGKWKIQFSIIDVHIPLVFYSTMKLNQ